MAELDPRAADAKPIRVTKADHQSAVACCSALLADDAVRVRDCLEPDARRLVGVVRVLAAELLAAVAREPEGGQQFVQRWGLSVAELVDDPEDPVQESAEPPVEQPKPAPAQVADDFPSDPAAMGRAMGTVLAAAGAARAERNRECWAILRGEDSALAAQAATSLFAVVLNSLDPRDAELRMAAWHTAARKLEAGQ